MAGTTLIVKQGLARLAYWRPVVLRLSLWVGLAVCTDLRNSLKEIAKKLGETGHITGFDWGDAALGALVAAFLIGRTFLDQTYSRHVSENPAGTTSGDHSKMLG